MKKAYFLSDAHLGAHYLANPRASEDRLVRFLLSIKDNAAELYLLGDILDYWYEYRTVVPRGHVRFFGALASLADAGVRIYWFTGNHDVWLFDYLENEIGLTVVRGHTELPVLNGTTFLLSHGDDVGYQRPMYRFTRWCFYNKVCQWLYAAIHPRWTWPIATGWSKQNRTSRSPQQEDAMKEECFKRLVDFSTRYCAGHPAVSHCVYGHLHLARQQSIGDGRDITVLGDWISQCTYATFDGNTVTLHRFQG